MSRASLVSFVWGAASTVVAAPIAGFLALFTFGRVILAGAPRRSRVPDLMTNPAPRRPLRIPALIFALFFLPTLGLVGHAWPSARQVPAYPAGVVSGMLVLGTLTWARSRHRRPGAHSLRRKPAPAPFSGGYPRTCRRRWHRAGFPWTCMES